MERRTILGLGAASLAALLWGSWFPLSRLMVRDQSMSAEDVAWLRFAIAAVVLLPLVRRHGLKAGRAGWLGTAIMPLCVGFPFAFLNATGLKFAPAAHAAMFVPGLFPVLTAILGVIILRDRLSVRSVAGTALVLAGVAGVGWSSLTGETGGSWQGYALFLTCASMWAVYSITTRIARIGPVHAVTIIAVVSMAVATPFYFMFGDVRLLTLPPAMLAFQVIYQGVGIGLVSMIAYNYAINVLGASQAAVFGGLVPCIAAVMAVPILGERLGWLEIAGVAAVTVGILLVNGARLPLAWGAALRRQST